MRQNGMSAEDAKFRIALENMRYARCTKQDIALLQTRIHDPARPGKDLHSERFSEVPVITAFNAYRDAINAARVREYASSRNLSLSSFYSHDLWGKNKDGASIRKAQKAYEAVVDPVRQSNAISTRIQEVLWAVPPALTEHHAGVLHLCVGMPVLLKFNEATELCATNGAAARVVKWDAHRMASGKWTLDTLFVELTKPPRQVQLPGLPPNVIPLTRTKKIVMCTLPADDIRVYVQREQVMVLPLFALTDFACQGHTLPDNVCHLKYCKNHQSIYTCLSRSSSLSGTIILDSFDTSKITGGASSALRREFRELELLDFITQRRLDGTLPEHVRGDTRGALLSSFFKWKGRRFVPDDIHPALNWAAAPESELTPCIDAARTLVVQQEITDCSSRSRPAHKRPANTGEWEPSRPPKRRNPQTVRDTAPYEVLALGSNPRLIWDHANWSCGYDAVLTLLWNLYVDLGDPWLRTVAPNNQLLSVMRLYFPAAASNPASLEICRDQLRDLLFIASPQSYPRTGQRKVSAAEVFYLLLTPPFPYSCASSRCTACSHATENAPRMSDSYVWILGDNLYAAKFPQRSAITTQEYIDALLTSGYPCACSACGTPSPTETTLFSAPPLLVLESLASGSLQPDSEVRIVV
ncbi:hypothetical protein OH76DRAFT_1324179, partial [Lentinus brumalis]